MPQGKLAGGMARGDAWLPEGGQVPLPRCCWHLQKAIVALVLGVPRLLGGWLGCRRPEEADVRVQGGMFALSRSSASAISDPKRPRGRAVYQG